MIRIICTTCSDSSPSKMILKTTGKLGCLVVFCHSLGKTASVQAVNGKEEKVPNHIIQKSTRNCFSAQRTFMYWMLWILCPSCGEKFKSSQRHNLRKATCNLSSAMSFFHLIGRELLSECCSLQGCKGNFQDSPILILARNFLYNDLLFYRCYRCSHLYWNFKTSHMKVFLIDICNLC